MARGAVTLLLALAGEDVQYCGDDVLALVFVRGRPVCLITGDPLRQSEGRVYGVEWETSWDRAAWCLHDRGNVYDLRLELAEVVTAGCRYWAVGRLASPGCGRRLGRIPDRWMPDVFLDGANVYETMRWCDACGGWVGCVDRRYACEHVFWCDVCEEWSTPGKRCGHADPFAGELGG